MPFYYLLGTEPINECERGFKNPNYLKSGGGGVLGLIFSGYLWLASQSPYPIIVYSVSNYRPYLSHFWANVILMFPT